MPGELPKAKKGYGGLPHFPDASSDGVLNFTELQGGL